MSDTEFDAEAQSTKLHAIYGRHHHHHHEHTLSAVDLTIKLEQLQIDTNINTEVDGQEPGQDDSLLSPNGEERRHHRSHSHRRHHSRHHSRSRSRSRSHSRQRTIAHVDPELQKWSHKALHEILERLEQQRRESEFFQSEDLGLVPGMEENGSGRMRHTLGLSPEVLRDLSSRHHSLKQSHGQANLRHSGHDDGT
ncbi:hypothetical protein EC957_008825 [Mortierella hygrophila]|uniref:Uncharacterized protein n=1 Tax=Mortierella hygrophila TaxID=979708 RepID=A0A9P6K5F4_9FUNG|nr:hypothetical protein EC957_008825 [Mortierella hygrophila]